MTITDDVVVKLDEAIAELMSIGSIAATPKQIRKLQRTAQILLVLRQEIEEGEHE